MDRHQERTVSQSRPAASVCHAVPENGVKHDGATAKTCDFMRNGMAGHGMAGKIGKGGKKPGVGRSYALPLFLERTARIVCTATDKRMSAMPPQKAKESSPASPKSSMASVMV